MREAHSIERTVGIDHYVSDAAGIGGRLRDRPEDFRVRELEAFDAEPADADPGAYDRLVLRATLRGWDTNDFAARFSDALGISRERVSWAGTKDKHAITTQLFTVRGGDPGAVPEIDDAGVEVVGRAGRDLGFGDLLGNAFRIRVRDPDRSDEAGAVTADLHRFATRGNARTADGAAAASDADGRDGTDRGSTATDGEPATRGTTVGAPNYFGQQRFGSRRPVTHEVGLRVVRRRWREAVLAYVGNPFRTEPADTRDARAFVEEEARNERPDWETALDRMPGRLRYERSMLHRLDEREADADSPAEDWRYALEAVPSNLQRLFVNAAQSYAFNRILSERLQRGLPFHRPVAGDVVCFADRDADGESAAASSTGSALAADWEVPGDLAVPDDDRTQRVTDRRVDVVARHCERGRAFVTAPLVGTETVLGDGDPGEIEREVLADLDLAPEDFDLPGEFESRGTRRPILVRTDVAVEREGDDLTFSFALPHGSYATVVLREYLKADPSDL